MHNLNHLLFQMVVCVCVFLKECIQRQEKPSAMVRVHWRIQTDSEWVAAAMLISESFHAAGHLKVLTLTMYLLALRGRSFMGCVIICHICVMQTSPWQHSFGHPTCFLITLEYLSDRGQVTMVTGTCNYLYMPVMDPSNGPKTETKPDSENSACIWQEICQRLLNLSVYLHALQVSMFLCITTTTTPQYSHY